MVRLLVNDELQNGEITHETLAQVLDWADRFLADRGLLVTAVRLDGVDEPSFRQPSGADRKLGAEAVIEIDAATPARLVAESLDEALSGLAGLGAHTLDVARRYRASRLAHANSGLSELTHGLGTLVALIEAFTGSVGLAFDQVTRDGGPAVDVIDDLGPPLAELTEAETNQDWATVADVLEFGLEPAIRRVAPFFTELATVVVARQAGLAPSH